MKRDGKKLLICLCSVLALGSLALAQGTGPAPGKVAAKLGMTMADLKTFAAAIEQYRLDVGSYPTSAEGLRALLSQPKGVKAWRGPYIRTKAGMPKDAWKHSYRYEGKAGKTFKVWSLGSDGKPGGSGDAADLVEHS